MIKRSVTFSYLFVFFLLALSSCEKDDEPEVNDEKVTLSELTSGEVKAYVDGELTTAIYSAGVLTDEQFTLVFNFTEREVLTITIDTLEAKSFELGPSYSTGVLISDSNTYVSSSGSIEISEVDTDAKTISGEFSLSLNWGGRSIYVSSGAFKAITYTVETITLPENGTFTATVNGDAWQAEEITASVNTQVNVLDITGKNAEGVNINIYMNSDVSTGTYDLTANGDNVAIVYPAGETMGTHYSKTGEITIVKHDLENKMIEAEFYFTATSQSNSDEYIVTDGEFTYEGYY